jgi:hypothetical protein
MLLRKITAVYSENHTKHINALCMQKAELLEVVHKPRKLLQCFTEIAGSTFCISIYFEELRKPEERLVTINISGA